MALDYCTTSYDDPSEHMGSIIRLRFLLYLSTATEQHTALHDTVVHGRRR
jgi:hypothetical protein